MFPQQLAPETARTTKQTIEPNGSSSRHKLKTTRIENSSEQDAGTRGIMHVTSDGFFSFFLFSSFGFGCCTSPSVVRKTGRRQPCDSSRVPSSRKKARKNRKKKRAWVDECPLDTETRYRSGKEEAPQSQRKTPTKNTTRASVLTSRGTRQRVPQPRGAPPTTQRAQQRSKRAATGGTRVRCRKR